MKRILKVKPILTIFLFILSACCAFCALTSVKDTKSTYARSGAIGNCYYQGNYYHIGTNGGNLGSVGCALFSLAHGIQAYSNVNVPALAQEFMYHAASFGYFTSEGTNSAKYYTHVEEAYAYKYNLLGGNKSYYVNSESDLDELKEHVSKYRNFGILSVMYDHYGRTCPHAMCVTDYDYGTNRFKVVDSGEGRIYWMSPNYLLNIREMHQYFLFRVEAPITPNTTANKVLNNATSKWDTTSNYAINSPNFANRKVLLNNPSGDNLIYFNQATNNMEISATFKIKGKVSSELWGKFGLTFLDNQGKGFFVYADAQGKSGTSASTITGTNIAIVKRNTSAAALWDWGASTNKNLKSNAFKYDSTVTLKIIRNGIRFDIYSGSTLIATINGTEYGIDMDEVVTPAILSWGIKLEVSNYNLSVTKNAIKFDGSLSDWKELGWNVYEGGSSAQSVTATNDSTKYARFYHKKTPEGLYIYAVAKHDVHITNRSNWWQNTNFEMFINGRSTVRQYYASINEVRGFDLFYYKTTGSEGNYSTVFEGFIPHKHNNDTKYIYDYINIGYAFKVENDAGTSDRINIKDVYGKVFTSSYWTPGGYNPRDCMSTIKAAKATEYTLDYNTLPSKEHFISTSQRENRNSVTKSGATLVFNNAQNNNYYFYEYESVDGARVDATFALTGKASSEKYGKIGLMFLNKLNDGFFFYADASGNTGTSKSTIKGTTFGVVYIDNNNYLWSNKATIPVINHASAKYSASTAFKMSVKFNASNNTYSLMVNDVVVCTLDGIQYGFYFSSTGSYAPCPSIHSFQVGAKITNYGVKKTAIDGLLTDGSLSDWKALSTWSTINSKKLTVKDSNGTGKYATFYYRLTSSGLHLAVEAKHAKHPTGNWREWWNNTNVEFFIGNSSYNNQFYASEFFTQGFRYSYFKTTYSSSTALYTTIFEGFIPADTLKKISNYNGKSIRLGFAFKAPGDTFTYNGKTTDYWCAQGLDPRMLNTLASIEA